MRFFEILEHESAFFTLYKPSILPVLSRQWGYVLKLEWREDLQLQWIRLRLSLVCLEFNHKNVSNGLSIICLDLH